MRVCRDRSIGSQERKPSLPNLNVPVCVVHCVQRSPSAWNVNPYVVVLALDEAARRRLADCMIGSGNADLVMSASATAVFAADLEPARLIPETAAMEAEAGKTPRYCRSLETDAAAALSGPYFQLPAVSGWAQDGQASSARGGGLAAGATGGPSPADAGVGLLSGHLHSWAQDVKRSVMTTASVALAGAAPVPTLNSSEGWAFKNTGLAAQTYMLAAASAGLATHPMEGLDAHMACRALGIPWPRYGVPMVVATGYAAGSGQGASASPSPPPARDTGSATASQPSTAQQQRQSARPGLDRMFRLDSFAQAFPFPPE